MARIHTIELHESKFAEHEKEINTLKPVVEEHAKQIESHATSIGSLTEGYNKNVRRIDKNDIFLGLFAAGFGIGFSSIIGLLIWIMNMISTLMKR